MTRDGRSLSAEPVNAVVGSPQQPLSTEELHAKFTAMVQHGTSGTAGLAETSRLFEQLRHLDELQDVRDLQKVDL